MTNREKFILKFISRYYSKSQRKRRSSKNQAHYIVRTINNVCKGHFHRNLEFTEEEIYKAFRKNRYSLMKSGEEDFSWDRYHEGNILILCNLFINIDTQSNHDLKLAMKKTYPPNWKPETIEKVDNLKTDLQLFWNEHKGKLEECN